MTEGAKLSLVPLSKTGRDTFLERGPIYRLEIAVDVNSEDSFIGSPLHDEGPDKRKRSTGAGSKRISCATATTTVSTPTSTVAGTCSSPGCSGPVSHRRWLKPSPGTAMFASPWAIYTHVTQDDQHRAIRSLPAPPQADEGDEGEAAAGEAA